ncbi:MAG: DNA repair protein RadA, partial [Alphaproteobacteria bacterium]|nr:DNA repair protein RadA [Alphaproteobacteria bacterium]
MINRKNKHFICRECGAKSGKWSGHCEACDAWNSFIEQEKKSPLDPRNSSSKGLIFPLFTLDGDASKSPTTPVGIPELDRVLGGGLVPGSA